MSRYLGIPLDRIATLGDQPNDVLMFEKSGLSIAMGNAGDDVKRRATCRNHFIRRRGIRQCHRTIHPAARRTRGGPAVKPTGQLHRMGQSLWLDNITRDLLNSGTLEHYIRDFSVTGLTSNPTIFEHAIKNSAAYDSAIGQSISKRTAAEDLFFELAIEDLTRAADLFRPIYDRTNGMDGMGLLGSLATASLRYGRHHCGRPNALPQGGVPT